MRREKKRTLTDKDENVQVAGQKPRRCKVAFGENIEPWKTHVSIGIKLMKRESINTRKEYYKEYHE